MVVTTRDRLVDAAHNLFYRHGFHTTGLDRVLSEVGVTKTTFYNHFESKDDLVLAVLDWHDRWWRETFTAMLHRLGGDDPRGQLLSVFDALEEMFNDEQYNGCMFINVAVEFPMPHDPAHRAAAEHKAAMVDILRELAERAGLQDPAGFAEQFALLMEGAYVTQHVTKNAGTAGIARRMGAALIEQHT